MWQCAHAVGMRHSLDNDIGSKIIWPLIFDDIQGLFIWDSINNYYSIIKLHLILFSLDETVSLRFFRILCNPSRIASHSFSVTSVHAQCTHDSRIFLKKDWYDFLSGLRIKSSRKLWISHTHEIWEVKSPDKNRYKSWFDIKLHKIFPHHQNSQALSGKTCLAMTLGR